MKRCPQCNRLYSDVTEKCPQCGVSLSGGLGSSTGAALHQQAQSSYRQSQNEYSSMGYQQQSAHQQPQTNNQQSSSANQQRNSSVSTVSSGKMGFGEAISICFKKYVSISGRASRAEYWWFYLFTMLGMWGSLLILYYVSIVGGYILMIALEIPAVAAGWRRLHDVGKCGALMLVPIYNLVLLVQKGETHDNQYGSVPIK